MGLCRPCLYHLCFYYLEEARLSLGLGLGLDHLLLLLRDHLDFFQGVLDCRHVLFLELEGGLAEEVVVLVEGVPERLDLALERVAQKVQVVQEELVLQRGTQEVEAL